MPDECSGQLMIGTRQKLIIQTVSTLAGDVAAGTAAPGTSAFFGAD